MPDPIDEGRDALNGAGPTKDLWADATARAADATVAPLESPKPPHRRGTWLAVAAAIALVAGTVGVLAMDDDDTSVDTTPATEIPQDDTTSTSIFGSEGCFFGVSGEAVAFTEGPSDPPLFAAAGQPEGQTIAHAALGSQVAEIHVPGLVLDDLIGERVEDIELRRGTAPLWFGPDFVQVRWFTGSQEPCDSFTLTVAGGTEDGNRHAAVDLADRILLPNDIGLDAPPTTGDDVAALLEGEWQLESSTIDGEPTDGTGVTFTFLHGEADWTDGCNSFSAPYTAAGDTTFRMGDITSTELPCPTNPTSQAVQRVMGSDQIQVDLGSGVDAMFLTADDTTLTLRHTDGEAGAAQEYGIWPMTAPESIVGYLPEFTGSQEEIAVAFAKEVLGWTDAVVTDREPTEDGRFGGVFDVRSESTGGVATIWAGPGDAPTHSTVYQVVAPGQTDPDATASVLVSGTLGRADIEPKPAGTAEATVRFTWGELWHEGPAGEDIDLFNHTGDLASTTPGAVLILFRNAAGEVIGAWGRTLPAGDFAAGRGHR